MLEACKPALRSNLSNGRCTFSCRLRRTPQMGPSQNTACRLQVWLLQVHCTQGQGRSPVNKSVRSVYVQHAGSVPHDGSRHCAKLQAVVSLQLIHVLYGLYIMYSTTVERSGIHVDSMEGSKIGHSPCC